MAGLADTLDATAPPAGLGPPMQALWWLAKGGFALGPEWDRAHDICQSAEGDSAHDRVHGLAHLIEGDIWNADYWARRSGHPRKADDPAEEWAHLVAGLG